MLDANDITCRPGCPITPGLCVACAAARFTSVELPVRAAAALAEYEAVAGGSRAESAAEWRAVAAELEWVAARYPDRSSDRRLNAELAGCAWRRADALRQVPSGIHPIGYRSVG